MYEFRELIGYIWQILMDAKELAEEALENKTDNPDLAAVYYHVASNHVTDADMLMKQAESCLAKAEKAQHEDFDSMDVLWSADHKRLIKQMGVVKVYMDMYR